MKTSYRFKKYVHLGRWVSYWYQISSVLNEKPQSVLVVGNGDKHVVEVLKKEVDELKTLDIDPMLHPDYIGSVESIPISDNRFDLVLCCEVLEHLPFEKFNVCLKELKRISRSSVILSLPHFGPPLKLSIKIPFFREVKMHIKLPYLIKHLKNEHYWEIGKKGFRAGYIRSFISKYFKIEREFIPFENQYHHFFILKK